MCAKCEVREKRRIYRPHCSVQPNYGEKRQESQPSGQSNSDEAVHHEGEEQSEEIDDRIGEEAALDALPEVDEEWDPFEED